MIKCALISRIVPLRENFEARESRTWSPGIRASYPLHSFQDATPACLRPGLGVKPRTAGMRSRAPVYHSLAHKLISYRAPRLGWRARPAAVAQAESWRSGLASWCRAVGIDGSSRILSSGSVSSAQGEARPQEMCPQTLGLAQVSAVTFSRKAFPMPFSPPPCVPLPSKTLPSLGALAVPHKPSSELPQVGPSPSSCWAHSSRGVLGLVG